MNTNKSFSLCQCPFHLARTGWGWGSLGKVWGSQCTSTWKVMQQLNRRPLECWLWEGRVATQRWWWDCKGHSQDTIKWQGPKQVPSSLRGSVWPDASCLAQVLLFPLDIFILWVGT